MRKIGRDASRAFLSGTPRIIGNTRVEVAGDTVVLRLHGNAIARSAPCVSGGRVLEVPLAGWPTPTTRSRLNDLFAVAFGYLAGAPRLWQERHEQRLRCADGSRVSIGSHGWHVAGLINAPKKG